MRDRIIPIGMLAAAAALLAAACGGGDEPSPVLDVPAPPTTEEQQQEEGQPAPEEEQPAPEEEQTEPDPNRELLAYGESLRTAITGVDQTRQFRFTGEAGDVVRISVNGHGRMDPLTTLQEPSRIDIATDDDSGPGRDALLVARLPSAGLQVVRISAFEGDIGEFTISIDRLPEDPEDENSIVRIGDVIQGLLGIPGDVDIFEFDGDTGQPVVIRADGILGTDTRAQIFGPDLIFLLEDDDSGHGLDAELRLVLPDAGSYRLEVFAVGNRIGPYELRINTDVPATEPSETLRETLEGLAITYLSALQEEKSPILLTLAGPELFQIWGWESAADVDLDYGRLYQPDGKVVDTRTELDGTERARVFLSLDVPSPENPTTVRFDLQLVEGQWRIDHWKQLFVVPTDESTDTESGT